MVGKTISYYKFLEKLGRGSLPPKEALEMASNISQILLHSDHHRRSKCHRAAVENDRQQGVKKDESDTNLCVFLDSDFCWVSGGPVG